jgi:hypothetical protein
MPRLISNLELGLHFWKQNGRISEASENKMSICTRIQTCIPSRFHANHNETFHFESNKTEKLTLITKVLHFGIMRQMS